MKCSINKQYSKSNVQRKNTKQQSKHGPLQQLLVGSGAMEVRASSVISADRSHPPYALCRNRENGQICRKFGE